MSEAKKKPRRDTGAGTIYERADGLWIGRAQGGYTKQGTRRRISVSAKTEAGAKRKLRDLIKAIDGGDAVGPEARTTIKQYAEQWMPRKEATLRPKGYAGVRTAMGWIVPTIGHRRLSALTAGDLARLERAQRDAGLKGSSCGTTQAHLMSMLNDAVRDGHKIAPAVLKAHRPATAPTDRQPIPLDQLYAILTEADTRADGLRWVLAILYGWRQSEVLGMTADAVDFETGRAWLDWQMQALPYRVAGDRTSGFRVPDEFEAVQIVGSAHLVRPKTAAGRRWAPITPALAPHLLRQVEKARMGKHGLLFARPNGSPRDVKADRREWYAIQAAVGAAHPSGRPWHVHECRNVAASRLREIGADDLAVTSLMGHTSINTTRIYQAVTDQGQAAAIEAVAKGLPGLG